MNNPNHFAGKLGLIATLTATLAGCVTHVHNSPEVRTVYVPAPAPEPSTPEPAPVVVQPAPIIIQAPPPVVEIPTVIHNEVDFNAPLSPYGEWIVVRGYGRCWRPRHVDASWRPYAVGRWEWTEAGWYWVSEEPWGWATYHYGRWDWTPEYGWIWAPQTQWAPAWVTWREGSGYIGWAPLPPTARIQVNGTLEIHGTIAASRFCFVETPRLLHPIRPANVIVNNTTIVNKTVNVTKVKVVNHVVINEGPRTDNIERVTGQRLHRNSVSEVRRRDENEARERRGRDHVTGPAPNRHESPRPTGRENEAGAGRPANAATPVVATRPVATIPPPEPVPAHLIHPEKQTPQSGGVKPEKAEPPVALNNSPAPQPVVETPAEKQPAVGKVKPEKQSPAHGRGKPEKTPGKPGGPAPVQSAAQVQPATEPAAVAATPPAEPRETGNHINSPKTSPVIIPVQANPSQVKASAPQTGQGPAETEFKSPRENASKNSSKKDKEKANGKGKDKNEDKNDDKQRERN